MTGLALAFGKDSITLNMVERIANGTGLSIQLVPVDGTEEAERIIGNDYPEVVFICIDSKLAFGLNVTRHITSNLSRTKIIWLSHRREDALMAYEEHVWHFFKLPLEEENLSSFKRRLQGE